VILVYSAQQKSFWRDANMPELRVLVADDHERMRWAIVSLLNADFEVVGAVGNGKELIEAAISLQPDVIVSDVSMPILTGIEAMQELRSGWHEVPFVLVSTSTIEAERWIEQGATAVVDKSDIGYDLVAAVRSVAKRELYFSRRARSCILPGLSSFNSVHFRRGITDVTSRRGPQDSPRIQAGPVVRILYGVD